jgi:hypothetical protein
VVNGADHGQDPCRSRWREASAQRWSIKRAAGVGPRTAAPASLGLGVLAFPLTVAERIEEGG